MGRGAYRAVAHGVAESDMTEETGHVCTQAAGTAPALSVGIPALSTMLLCVSFMLSKVTSRLRCST